MMKCPGVEQALMAVPEVVFCPYCAGEVEIWTDEKRGKRLACKKSILREDAKKQRHADVDPMQGAAIIG